MRRGLLALGAGGLAIAVGLYTLAIVADDPADSFAGASTIGRVALLAGGWALVAAGLGSWLRSPALRSGPLLVAAGFGWFLLDWVNPRTGSALAFTAGLALYASCPPLVGHAALVAGGARLSRVERAAVALAYCASLLVLGLLPTFFRDWQAEGCNDCPRNLLLIEGRPSTVDDLNRVGVWLAAGAALSVAVLTGLRLVRSSVGPRRSRLPVLAAATVYAGLVAGMYAASTGRGLLWNGTLERRLRLWEALVLVVLALSAAWGWGRARRRRAAVARITLELAHSPPPGGLRDALAEIVGDPGLRLAFPLGDSGRLIDVRGDEVVLGPGQDRTTLTANGRPLAVLAHAPHLLDDAQLVAEVAAAARLALENERLQAQSRTRVGELRRSRERIVETGDAERRRLERDLHDGAQQRLVGLALSLRLVRARLAPGAEPAVAAAEAELRAAIDALRELAHGIFPAVLADAGLGPALGALAEDSRAPIRLDGFPAGRYPPAVETAAYLVVAEAATAAADGLVVHAERAHGRLLIEVEAHALDERLDRAELEDRVAAAEGRLFLEPQKGGVRLRAEFPCAS